MLHVTSRTDLFSSQSRDSKFSPANQALYQEAVLNILAALYIGVCGLSSIQNLTLTVSSLNRIFQPSKTPTRC